MEIHNRILELLLDDEEITWKSILTNLVKSEEQNPWDVDIAFLSDKFIDTIRELKRMDFRISGKIVLAAAILLRIKSVYLVTNDIAGFDRLLEQQQEDDSEEESDDIPDEVALQRQRMNATLDKFGIVPRTPLPRKRKVSVYDLIDALQKAMDFKNKKVSRIIDDKKDDRLKKLLAHDVDITVIIQDIYSNILNIYGQHNNEIPFDKLLPKKDDLGNKDRVLTLLPLLHLETKHKILINQDGTFGPIRIQLLEDKNEE